MYGIPIHIIIKWLKEIQKYWFILIQPLIRPLFSQLLLSNLLAFILKTFVSRECVIPFEAGSTRSACARTRDAQFGSRRHT